MSRLTYRRRIKFQLHFLITVIVLSVSLAPPLSVNAQCPSPGGVCGTPGNDGAGGTLTGVVNDYFPGTANAAAGATTIRVGAQLAGGAGHAINSGDLLLVIQMQGADINTTNGSNYGSGTTGTPSGYLNNANLTAGNYEYVLAASHVATTGGTITITGGGTGTGLINSYVTGAFVNGVTGTGHGQRTFQVVRVPQYTTATLSSTLTAAPWTYDPTNTIPAAGGILALDVSTTLTLGGTVSVDGCGFRGGGGQQLAGAGMATTSTDYVNTTTNAFHGNKGEGIAGTPRYVLDAGYSSGNGLTVINTNSEGYPEGSRARGAPGNAGGGGTDDDPKANDENSGGGGGGNGGAGGGGGLCWDTQAALGGFGGAAFAQASTCRIVMGGGGGSGTRNNDDTVTLASTGVAGGGIVMMRTRFVAGTGTITANGLSGYKTPSANDTANDGGGGGGAGGTILFSALTTTPLSGLTVSAKGGDGGNAWDASGPGDGGVDTGNNHHGPGGGGGGGIVYLSATAASISVAGGAAGTSTTDGSNFSATAGSNGTSSTTLTASGIPGVFSGAQCTPTAVSMESFTAKPHGNGVALNWKTGFEVDNLGFNIYREESGEPVRINPSLIAGSALITRPGKALTAGWSYAWFDPVPLEHRIPRYYLEDIDLRGNKTWHGPIGVDFLSQDSNSSSDLAPAMLLREIGRDQTEPGRTFGRLERKVEPAQDAVKDHPQAFLQQSSLAGSSAIKISVQKEGWYQITQQQLIAAGLPITANPSTLQLFLDGSEIPILVGGSSPSYSIQFFGLGANTQYTNTNVYWLVWGLQTGMRIPTVAQNATQPAPVNFPYTVQLLERTVYFPGALDGAMEDFFGDPIEDSAPTPESLQVTGLDQMSTLPCTLQVVIQGVTNLPHRVLITFNGNPVGEDDFAGITEGTATVTVPRSQVLQGTNSVSLIAAAGDSDISLLDHINLTYPHIYTATGNALQFTVPGNQRVSVGGFANANVRVVDVTNPNSVFQVAGAVQQVGSVFSVTCTDPTPGTRTLYAFTSDQALAPASIVANQPSNWGQAGHGADMVILANSMFINQMSPLVSLKLSQGLRVSVIDVAALYDDFNFGQKDPQAIKTFLSYTQSNWFPAPRFVLMAGKGCYDPKNYLGFGFFDLVPTKLINTQIMQADSDDWFVDFNNDGVPELAIGRLPARNTQEMGLMIQKTLQYQSAQPRGGALMVCDVSDDFDFLGTTLQMEGFLPAGLTPTLVDRGSNPNAEAALINGLNSGQKLVNYSGHASVDLWRGNFLTDSSALTLTNGQSLPFFVMMTCLDGSFDDPSLDSLAESLMKAPQGGAAFVWASSAITQPASQGIINKALLQLLFNELPSGGGGSTGGGNGGNGGGNGGNSGNIGSGTLTMGQAAAKSKAFAGDLDVRRTWIFFGDPSMLFKH